MLLKPFGYHWTFEECEYSILPKRSEIRSIFINLSFVKASNELVCGDVEFSRTEWKLHEARMFLPFDCKMYVSDKLLSGVYSDYHTRFAFTPLPKKITDALLGRINYGFIFNLVDLLPYKEVY